MRRSGAVGCVCAPMDLAVKHGLHGNFTPVKLAETAAGLLTSGALAVRVGWEERKARKGAIALP